jgi:hypothetical protein
MGCPVWLAIVGGLLASPCAGGIALLYSAGFFDTAPELPEFARPVDAEELGNDEVKCGLTDDFGPYGRELAFGSNRRADAIHNELTHEFERRSWTVHQRPDDPSFRATAPHGDVEIQYDFVDADNLPVIWSHRVFRALERAPYPTLLLVRLWDC